MAATTKTNKRGGTVTTEKKGDKTVRSTTKKSGATKKVATNKNGSKTVTKSRNARGGSVQKTVNKKGDVTSITKTKKDGTTKKLGAAQVAAKNKLKGEGGLASRFAANKDAKKAARKSGDTAKLKELRSKSKAIKKKAVRRSK